MAEVAEVAAALGAVVAEAEDSQRLRVAVVRLGDKAQGKDAEPSPRPPSRYQLHRPPHGLSPRPLPQHRPCLLRRPRRSPQPPSRISVPAPRPRPRRNRHPRLRLRPSPRLLHRRLHCQPRSPKPRKMLRRLPLPPRPNLRLSPSQRVRPLPPSLPRLRWAFLPPRPLCHHRATPSIRLPIPPATATS